MTLISSFSILGLGNGLIRYLPTSERKNKKINTSFTLVGLTSMFISIFFLVFLKTFSPRLLFVRENINFSLLLRNFFNSRNFGFSTLYFRQLSNRTKVDWIFLEKTKMVKDKKINYKPLIRIDYCFWWSSSTL